jgi:hypothetical protein
MLASMDVHVRFPSEREKLAEEVARWRSSTPAERLLAALELSDLCEALRASSPRRERQVALLEEKEREGRRLWMEVIQRHGG